MNNIGIFLYFRMQFVHYVICSSFYLRPGSTSHEVVDESLGMRQTPNNSRLFFNCVHILLTIAHSKRLSQALKIIHCNQVQNLLYTLHTFTYLLCYLQTIVRGSDRACRFPRRKPCVRRIYAGDRSVVGKKPVHCNHESSRIAASCSGRAVCKWERADWKNGILAFDGVKSEIVLKLTEGHVRSQICGE